jgi:hypothetical protein
MKPLLLHHEIMLLALRDEEGTVIGAMYPYAIAGAMLSELALQKSITVSDDKKQLVEIAGGKLPSNFASSPLLNEVIEMISSSKKPRGATEWVMKIAGLKDLKHRVARELCDLKVLKEGEDKVLWIFPRKIYPEHAAKFEREIKDRMTRLMFGQSTEHDERTTLLVSLAKHAGLLPYNFDKERLKRNKDRIDKVASGDMFAARATKDAIVAVQTAIMVATMVPAIAATSHS